MTYEDLMALPEVAKLRTLPNVTDVGFGLRTIDGRTKDELAIIVTVKAKVPRAELTEDELVPANVADFPTDVETQANPEDFQVGDGDVEDRKRVRPLLSGVSIGITSSHSGTLGFFARRNSDNKPVLVSNYHILFRDRALPGNAGTPHVALQPPVGSSNKVGDVEGGALQTDAVDAAYAVIGEEGSSCCCRSAIKYDNKTRNTQASGPTDSVQLKGVARAKEGDVVHKTGRTTDKTTGKVKNPNLTSLPAIDYSSFNLPAGNSFNFGSVIEIVSYDPDTDTLLDSVAFSGQGDSGSAVYNTNGEIVGLHFLSMFNAAQNIRRSYAFHIEDVEAALGITVGGTRDGLAAAAEPDPPVVAHNFDPDDDEFLIGGVTFARGPVDEIAKTLDAALSATASGRAWREIFEEHQFEVLGHVNRKRGVTLAWRRGAGPSWLAALMRSAQTPGYTLPEQIDGWDALSLARAMRKALWQDGSAEMRADLDRYGDQLEALIAKVTTAGQGVRLLAEHAPAARETVVQNG